MMAFKLTENQILTKLGNFEKIDYAFEKKQEFGIPHDIFYSLKLIFGNSPHYLNKYLF